MALCSARLRRTSSFSSGLAGLSPGHPNHRKGVVLVSPDNEVTNPPLDILDWYDPSPRGLIDSGKRFETTMRFFVCSVAGLLGILFKFQSRWPFLTLVVRFELDSRVDPLFISSIRRNFLPLVLSNDSWWEGDEVISMPLV